MKGFLVLVQRGGLWNLASEIDMTEEKADEEIERLCSSYTTEAYAKAEIKSISRAEVKVVTSSYINSSSAD